MGSVSFKGRSVWFSETTRDERRETRGQVAPATCHLRKVVDRWCGCVEDLLLIMVVTF